MTQYLDRYKNVKAKDKTKDRLDGFQLSGVEIQNFSVQIRFRGLASATLEVHSNFI